MRARGGADPPARRCCSSTSRRSASTSRCRSRCATSSAATTSAAARPILLTSHYMDDVAALCPRVDRHRPRPAVLRRRARGAGAPRCARRSASCCTSSGRSRRRRLGAPRPGGLARAGAQAVLQVAAGAGCATRSAARSATLPVRRPDRRERAARGGDERAVRPQPRGAGARSRPRREAVPDRCARCRRCCASASPRRVAYRAEMLVWILSTTMPLIMLALWSAVAARGAGRPLRRRPSSPPTSWPRSSSGSSPARGSPGR